MGERWKQCIRKLRFWPPISSIRAAARHFDLFSIKPIKTTNCSYHLHWDYAQHQLTFSRLTRESVLFSLRVEPWQTSCLTVSAHYHLGDRLVGRMVSGLIEHSPALFSVLFLLLSLLPSFPSSFCSFPPEQSWCLACMLQTFLWL